MEVILIGLSLLTLVAVLIGMALVEDRMSTNQEKLNALADQLDKAQREIVDAVDALKAQVEAGESLDFSRIEAAAQALDDLNPDEVVEPDPEPEVPFEPETGDIEPNFEE